MRQARSADDAPGWWWVTRKALPATGGMERLSSEVTGRLAQRFPLTVHTHRGGRGALPVFLADTALRLRVACRERRVSVLHLGDPVLAPLAGIARRAGVPVSVTIHGLDVAYGHPLYRLWVRRHLARFDAYVCISAAAAEASVAAGVPRERVHVIGIGVDVPPMASPPVVRDAASLLFVGRLVERKGLEWFVREVLPPLAIERPQLMLNVIGAGPCREAIGAAARRAGVVDRVRFKGAVDDAAKWRWLARAGICVMPNVPVAGDLEGYGIVALEAAAAGCPLLAADLEGLRDAVIPETTGRLLPAGDAYAWRRALREWLDDPAAREVAGARARAGVEAGRRWDDVVDRYGALLSGLARDGAAAERGMGG